jgi:hypothetical protein
LALALLLDPALHYAVAMAWSEERR